MRHDRSQLSTFHMLKPYLDWAIRAGVEEPWEEATMNRSGKWGFGSGTPTPKPKWRENPIDVQCARGLMEGIAVGNLLGITLEGQPRQQIARTHPEGVREIHASPGYADDDDLAQSIVIAEAALEGPLDVEALAERFWDWGDGNGLGMGGLTCDVLNLYGGRRPQRLRRQPWAQNIPRGAGGLPIVEASKLAWGGDRAGNGALMRCAPLALRWAHEPMRLVRESVISAVPSHWDARCGWSCVLANLALAATLRGGILLADELIELGEEGVARALPELEQYGYQAKAPDSVVQAVQAAWNANPRSHRSLGTGDFRLDGGDMGFTLLTLKVALNSLWTARDFESGLSEVMEAGGDTDTNGAVVGAVLGARFGLAGIPNPWRARVLEIRAGRRPMAAHADALLEAAGTG